MRISDWSSDVCSSDLRLFVDGGRGLNHADHDARDQRRNQDRRRRQRRDPQRLLRKAHEEIGVFHESDHLRSVRSEEHTSELQSLMRISYAVFCLKKKTKKTTTQNNYN